MATPSKTASKKAAPRRKSTLESSVKKLANDAVEVAAEALKKAANTIKEQEEEINTLQKRLDAQASNVAESPLCEKPVKASLANLVQANLTLGSKLMDELAILSTSVYRIGGKEVNVERTRPQPADMQTMDHAVLFCNQNLDWILGKLRELNTTLKAQL